MNEICSLIYRKFDNLSFRWLPCFTTAQNLQRCQLCCHILNSKWRRVFRLFYKLTSQDIIFLAKGWPHLAKIYHSINLNLTVLFTLTKVWLPQLLGNRQYVSTLKTKVWQFALNWILFFSLIFTLNVIHMNSSERGYFYNIFVLLLYVFIGSTFLSNKNCCKKLEQTKTLKIMFTELALFGAIMCNGDSQLDVGSANWVIICGFLLLSGAN